LLRPDVGGVDAGRIVDGVGVELDAFLRRFDAAALGRAEIGAFADHPGAHIRARDTDRIIGAIADLIVAFPRSADIGADAAKPEQVDACLQDRPHHLEGRGLRPIEIEQRPHFQCERDCLE
jgi:hypothetical protein